MSAELVTLAAPYVTAAVKAYGTAVLQKGDDATDATVGLGRRILQSIFGTRPAPEALTDLAEEPDDEDLQAALRVHLRKLLAADEPLANQIRDLLTEAPPAGVTITASGDRSIAAHTISGIASIGDNNNLTQQ